MAVEWVICEDDGRLLARLSGPLDRHAVSSVRGALLKCLAEEPDALIVDVAGLIVHDRLSLAVFTAVMRQAALWPGTPVLLCAPSPHTAGLLRAAVYRRIPIFPTVDVARNEARNHRVVLPTVSDELLPVAGAARQARNVATDACLRWDLVHLIGPSSMVAGELVSNVVEHAGTMMTLRLSLTERYLQIAVRDGSTAEPRLDGGSPLCPATGRGLRLVDAVARSWGSLPATGGKVVWASLARNEAAVGA
jgi:hypothetical protein